MPQIIGTRSVLAVRDLERSTRFYKDVLGFTEDPIRAEGWSFLSRGALHVMLGECADERPAGETGNHSYFMHVLVEGIDDLHAEVVQKGAPVINPLADKPWGLREFGIQTPDGHRIVFGETIARR